MDAVNFRECRAILFDFGGTLDSDGEHWLDRFYELYEYAGLGIHREDIKRVFYEADDACCRDPKVNDLGLRALMHHHVGLQFQALGLDRSGERQMLVEAFCSKTEGFLRRNAQLLSRLKRRYRLGVVSNFYGNVTVLCQESGLSESLDVILDSTIIGISKPNPEIFHTALRKLDLVPGEAIFVGDSYDRDMMPSRGLGLKTIWMKGPNPRVPVDAGPVDDIISSLNQLDALVL